MRRVLHLIKGLGRGGAEQLLLSAAPYLDRSTFDYSVAYVLPWKDALVEDLERAGLPTVCLDGARGVNWVTRLRRLVIRERIELVHSHSPLPATAARLALPRTVRHVYTEHGIWGHYRRATYWLNLLTYPRNDHVFAVSSQVKESIRYPRVFLGRRLPPIETLHHGIDHAAVPTWAANGHVREELKIPDEAPLVGIVANFRALKGHRQLLHAMPLVLEAVPDARLVMVGRGPLEAEIREEIKHSGLSDSVLVVGYRLDAQRIASAFDVFVLPSLLEGLPIALLEAMALGRASVATRVGGIPEVVEHGQQALLVPPGDPVSLAKAIVTLLQDRALRDRLGAAARDRAMSFDIRKAVDREQAIYREVLS